VAKTAILVDNAYLEKAAILYNAYPVDMTKLPQVVLAKDDEHFKTYVFDALPYLPKENATPDQKEKHAKKSRYLDALQYKERLTVEQGHVTGKGRQCPKCGTKTLVPVQKGVDVRIAVRMGSLARGGMEKIALIAGDADLVPAVEDVGVTNTIVKLVYARVHEVNTSPRLIMACPEKHQLTPQDLQFLKLT